MSVHKRLPDVVPMFEQTCPICERKQRMIVRGWYIHKDKEERYPDIGYSFCNCHNIFFTNYENVKSYAGITSEQYPVDYLMDKWHQMYKSDSMTITMPDVYFCDWRDPSSWKHWLPRKHHILWDMDSFCDVAKLIGFEVVSAKRDMDVESRLPQHMIITLRK